MSTEQFVPDVAATRTSKPAPVTEPPAPKPAWRRPTLTCIEIKRTLNGSSILNDGPGSEDP